MRCGQCGASRERATGSAGGAVLLPAVARRAVSRLLPAIVSAGPAVPRCRTPRPPAPRATDRRRPCRTRSRWPSAGCARCCSATSWALPRCRSRGTRRRSANCCPSTSRWRGRSSAGTGEWSRSSSGTRSWRCGGAGRDRGRRGARRAGRAGPGGGGGRGGRRAGRTGPVGSRGRGDRRGRGDPGRDGRGDGGRRRGEHRRPGPGGGRAGTGAGGRGHLPAGEQRGRVRRHRRTPAEGQGGARSGCGGRPGCWPARAARSGSTGWRRR